LAASVFGGGDNDKSGGDGGRFFGGRDDNSGCGGVGCKTTLVTERGQGLV
jgi:hypothetical protein